MDRREKQRKFHQAIIDMLYLPPTPRQHTEEVEDDPMRIISVLGVNQINDPENFDSPSSSSDGNDEDGDLGPHKLTRAQRKRLRKKKLKQSSTSSPQRRKIIGPLLASPVNKPKGDSVSMGEYHTPGVRGNAAENQSQNAAPDSEECGAQKEAKSKRRRMAKKLAREKTKL
ncbi:hypothetical protein V2J09_016214 [Rumex salicifolius]